MKSKHLLISIGISLIFFSTSFASDLLDNIKDNSKLVNDLKDVYRAFNINHIISNQNELLGLYLHDGSDDVKDSLNQYIKVCEYLKQTHFSNSTLDAYVHKYIGLTIQSYTIARTKGFQSTAFKVDNKKYEAEYGKYLDYLSNTYPTNYFVKLSEEKYWNTLNKSNYIRSKDFVTYQKLKGTDIKAALNKLDSIDKNTIDYQEHVIYKIEEADQYVKDSGKLAENGRELAVNKYNTILNEKKYCIYLFETWVKWRAVLQSITGLSKSSDIPNAEYNKKRQQVAAIILNYITTHPKDEMAINEFLLMATHDIVKRFGDYPYGNQSTIEYHELFDDK